MKKVSLLLLLVLLIASVLTSCSKSEPKTRRTFYKATLLENNISVVIGSTEPSDLTLPGYETGDTVWVNTRTRSIDPADSLGMMAVIEGCPDTKPFTGH